MSKKLLSNISTYSVLATIFLLPIFFLPWTSELLDFNKQYLLYGLSLLALLAWTLKGVLERKFEIVRTPLDVPLLIILLATLVSSLLSADRYVSFWGDLVNINYGFIPLVFYVLFYFLAVNVLDSQKLVKKALMLLATSGSLGALYFILKGLNLLKLAGAWPTWNSVSALTSLFGLFLSLVTVFALSHLMRKDEARLYWFWIPVLVLSFAANVMIGFRSTWTGLAVALVLLLIFAIARLDEVKVSWVSATFALMIIAILLAFLSTPRILTAKVGGEIALSPSTSWKISRETVSSSFKNFLFGSGPATFVYDFSKSRPEDFNNNFAWNVRFLAPYNNILALLATTGLLGIVAFLVVLLTVLGSSFITWFKISPPTGRKKNLLEATKNIVAGDSERADIYFAVLTGWLLLTVHLFLTNFQTTLWWLFYLLLAIMFSLPLKALGVREQKISLKTSPQYSLVSSFVTILLFAGVIVLGVYLGRFYAADVYARAAKNHGNLDKAIASFNKSVTLAPGRYQYHLGLAASYITRASEELGKSDANVNLIRELVAQAVNEARRATDISPKNVNAWEFLADMYNNARQLTDEAIRFQIAALEEAIKLEPTNPVLHLNLGNAKFFAGNVAEAREKYKEAVRLKPNFVSGYLSLSVLEEQTGNVTESIEYAVVAAQLSPQDPATVYNLARLYYNRNQGDDLTRAEQLSLYISVELNPNYSDALYTLALINERRGNDSEALKYYRKVQALNPDNKEIRVKVQSLLGPPAEGENSKKKR